MFVSRTVAAEVCMEAQTNVTAFSVLRTLDSKGELRFDLSCVSFHALHANLFSFRVHIIVRWSKSLSR